jgi:hypothetical protein
MKGRLMFAPRGWLKRPIYKEIYTTLNASPIFDKAWYRTKNLGFPHRFFDPVWHYITKGWSHGVDPGPFFDTSYYVSAYRDVRETGINPLYHYVKYGKQEQRSSLRSGTSIASYYLEHTTPLRTILVGGSKKARTTLVIDSHTPQILLDSLPEVVGNFITPGESLRILLRDLPGSTVLATKIHAHQQPGFAATITALSPDDRYTDVVRFAEERFVATSWSSNISLAPLRDITPVFSTIPGGNPADTLATQLVGLTDELCEQSMVAALTGVDLPERGGDANGAEKLLLETSGRIGIYCDPTTSPLGFLRSIELIEALLLEHPTDSPLPEIFVWGGPIEPFAFWGSIVPQFVSPEEASRLASSTTALVALSEHPLPTDVRNLLAVTPGLVISHDATAARALNLRRLPFPDAIKEVGWA